MEPEGPFSEEVKKKLERLPKEVQSFVYSAEMAALIQQVGQKHQLHIDQVGALEAETAAAMIGVTNPAEFVQNVADALEVDEGKSAAIAKDVNELVFMKVQSVMKAPSASSAPATPTPTPQAVPPTPIPPAPIAAPSPAPTPAPAATPTPPPTPKVEVAHPADDLLTQKSVTTAPNTAAPAQKPVTQPPPYKATDPYREPIE